MLSVRIKKLYCMPDQMSTVNLQTLNGKFSGQQHRITVTVILDNHTTNLCPLNKSTLDNTHP